MKLIMAGGVASALTLASILARPTGAAPVTGHSHQNLVRGCLSNKNWKVGMFCQKYSWTAQEKADNLAKYIEGQEEAARKQAEGEDGANEDASVHDERHVPVWSVDYNLTHISDINDILTPPSHAEDISTHHPSLAIEERKFIGGTPPIGLVTGHCGNAYIVASHAYLNKLATKGTNLANLAELNGIKGFRPIPKGQEKTLPFCAQGGFGKTPQLDLAWYTVPAYAYRAVNKEHVQTVTEVMFLMSNLRLDSDIYFPTGWPH